MIAFTAPLEVAHPPAYLELDRDAKSIRVREMPEREQIPIQCETSLVIEYYSR
jgi:ribosomal protein S4